MSLSRPHSVSLHAVGNKKKDDGAKNESGAKCCVLQLLQQPLTVFEKLEKNRGAVTCVINKLSKLVIEKKRNGNVNERLVSSLHCVNRSDMGCSKYHMERRKSTKPMSENEEMDTRATYTLPSSTSLTEGMMINAKEGNAGTRTTDVKIENDKRNNDNNDPASDEGIIYLLENPMKRSHVCTTNLGLTTSIIW